MDWDKDDTPESTKAFHGFLKSVGLSY